MKTMIFLPKHIFTFLSLFGLTVMIVSCTDLSGSITTTPMEPAPLTQSAQGTGSSTPSAAEIEKISFDPLSKSFQLGSPSTSPALLLAFDDEGLEAIDPLIDKDDSLLIHSVNLAEQILVAAFWGPKPAGGYSIIIDDVHLAGNELIVEVLLQDSDPEFPKIEAATSPYYIIVLDKHILTDIINRYQMINNDVVLASGTIP
jgi:hypothetical protein